MSCKLPALRKTATRQFTAGNALILIVAMWLFLPYLLDRYRNEPSMTAVLTMVPYGNTHLVDDVVTLKYPTAGNRVNTLQDVEGRIICQKQVSSVWESNKHLVWHIFGFVGCEPPPNLSYRVCSYFAVHSRGGIERKIGANNKFCSNIVEPPIRRNY